MPKTQKQTGYLVKIEAFVPADLADTQRLIDLQNRTGGMKEALGNATLTITPTRR